MSENRLQVGRVLRAGVQGFVVGCELKQPDIPPFGSFVRASSITPGNAIYGLVYNVSLEDDLFARHFVGRDIDEGVIKDKDTTLLELQRGVSLEELLGGLGGRVVKFTPNGEKKNLSSVLTGKVTAVVGGFSKGDYLSRFDADTEVSVYDEELTSWAVVGEILNALRN